MRGDGLLGDTSPPQSIELGLQQLLVDNIMRIFAFGRRHRLRLIPDFHPHVT